MLLLPGDNLRMAYLLDTNIVTAILKNQPLAKKKLLEFEIRREGLFISCITYFEVKRGLEYINATRQLSDLDELCRKAQLLFLDNIEIIERGCKIYTNLRARGISLEDADILIAATAIARGLILVSHDSDMVRVPDLTLEDWLQTES